MESESVRERLNADMRKKLDICKDIHKTKEQDYGMCNFINAAKIASILTDQDIRPMDVAACLIGIKFARYGKLVVPGKKIINESVEDTVLDSINYILLMERERFRNEIREGLRDSDTFKTIKKKETGEGEVS